MQNVSRQLWFLALLYAAVGSFVQSALAADNATDWSFGRHTKYQYIHTRIPADSIFQAINADRLQDHNLEARLKVAAQRR